MFKQNLTLAFILISSIFGTPMPTNFIHNNENNRFPLIDIDADINVGTNLENTSQAIGGVVTPVSGLLGKVLPVVGGAIPVVGGTVSPIIGAATPAIGGLLQQAGPLVGSLLGEIGSEVVHQRHRDVDPGFNGPSENTNVNGLIEGLFGTALPIIGELTNEVPVVGSLVKSTTPVVGGILNKDLL